MSLYHEAVVQPLNMLANLDRWLDKAVAHAEANGFDADHFATRRLAPDMYPLKRQVQAACDTAKFAAARLAGIEAPRHPDDETTLGELKQRVSKVRAWLQTVDADAVESGGDHIIKLPFLPPDKGVSARNYLRQFALPNFYFHCATAYGILRHDGVQLGKRDFIGSMELVDCA